MALKIVEKKPRNFLENTEKNPDIAILKNGICLEKTPGKQIALL